MNDKNKFSKTDDQCFIQNIVSSDLRRELVLFAYWYENEPKEREGCNTIGNIVDAYLNSKSYTSRKPNF